MLALDARSSGRNGRALSPVDGRGSQLGRGLAGPHWPLHLRLTLHVLQQPSLCIRDSIL